MDIETKNLDLRHYKLTEKAPLKSLLLDEMAMKFVGNGRAFSEKEINHLWRRIHEVNYVENKIGVWGIFSKEDSRYIGHAAIKPRSENESEWEIVYYLLKEEWGKGLGTEVAQQLVEIGFNKFNLKNVYATVDEKNTASIRILEKIGMRFFQYEFDDLGRFSVYWINSENQR